MRNPTNRRPIEMDKTCFMIVNYSPEFSWVNRIAQDVFEKRAFVCNRPDRAATRGNFMDEVGSGVRDADVVYVDITGDNPNVLYELGIAHTLHKSTIVVKRLNSERTLDLPADLRGYKVITYSQDRIEDFVNELDQVIKGPLDKDYGNPVFEATRVPSHEIIRSVLSNIVTSAMHPFTAILIEQPAARVEAVSTEANRLFGYEPNSKELRDKGLEDLTNRIHQWMNEDDYKRFIEDQMKNSLAYADGSLVFAQVPIKFNSKHPDPNFRNKHYLPFIVGFTEPEPGSRRYATVLYLRLDDLPRDEICA
jgi:hypothetical protein